MPWFVLIWASTSITRRQYREFELRRWTANNFIRDRPKPNFDSTSDQLRASVRQKRNRQTLITQVLSLSAQSRAQVGLWFNGFVRKQRFTVGTHENGNVVWNLSTHIGPICETIKCSETRRRWQGLQILHVPQWAIFPIGSATKQLLRSGRVCGLRNAYSRWSVSSCSGCSVIHRVNTDSSAFKVPKETKLPTERSYQIWR